MPLNLISDPWIPVLDTSGARRVIAPWQMADPDLQRPDWPRADLDIACLELLVGLVRLVDSPAHADDWEDRQKPDPDRLRDRLAPFAAAFDLLGEGPRFLQERGGLDGEVRPPDTLFIDSGGEGGALTVREGRYPALDLPLAAMALYAMQTQAPSGGRGNLTSLRGGGPMSVLVDPGRGLWPLVWANVPDREPDERPATPDDLPWMRRTVPSDRGAQHFPHQGHPAEVFFGMPRRFRLVAEGDRVSGVIQRPSGTRYVGWRHPLTPYYRQKPGGEALPVRPRAGVFGYRHWLGVSVKAPGDLKELPQTVTAWHDRSMGREARLIVAGWAMENMKARDYVYAQPPLVDIPQDRERLPVALVEAADLAALALRGALAPVLAEGEAREAAREEFYIRTHDVFEARLRRVRDADPGELAKGWREELQKAALAIFDDAALPGMADRPLADQQAIVAARRHLGSTLAGYGASGGKLFDALFLPRPAKRKEEAKA